MNTYTSFGCYTNPHKIVEYHYQSLDLKLRKNEMGKVEKLQDDYYVYNALKRGKVKEITSFGKLGPLYEYN